MLRWIIIFALATPASGVDLVKHGTPAATIVIKSQGLQGKVKQAKRQKRRAESFETDADAAEVLVDWVQKISGAKLPIATAAGSCRTKSMTS